MLSFVVVKIEGLLGGGVVVVVRFLLFIRGVGYVGVFVFRFFRFDGVGRTVG